MEGCGLLSDEQVGYCKFLSFRIFSFSSPLPDEALTFAHKWVVCLRRRIGCCITGGESEQGLVLL